MQATMEMLNEEIKKNPDILDVLLESKFNWESFVEGAKKIGFKIGLTDVIEYLEEKYPPTSPEAGSTYYAQDERQGEFRELSNNEINLVSGGTTVVAGVVAVVAVGVFVGGGGTSTPSN
ncbi:hypothetical protein [Pseudoalteromonas piscicida]|uniref:Nif11 domain-containing protein n=1 Tax=Pseudoalteromonas piscicida TaxID=43662 RepID=A0A2A5JSH5_PSEO7|nr:hypothetical protein [Pseudoalteromonas piscicida]PCK32422.1 hypothetical protein CEX98_07265 [Pseudoalteromonas piscicida]